MSTSASLSLAALEYLVHVDPDNLPDDLVQINVIVPDVIVPIVLDRSRLPATWREYPAPDETARIGDDWLLSGSSLLFYVPSVLIPEENNVLINPRHEDFGQLRIDSISDFSFDPRLYRLPRKNPLRFHRPDRERRTTLHGSRVTRKKPSSDSSRM